MTLSPEVEVTRAVVLHETSTAITKLRGEPQNLAPLDDPIPGAPPNAFQMIRAIFNEFSAQRKKAMSAGSIADKT